MRDDLHRGAPVASHWRTVIKRCASEAEWTTEGRRAFERAVARDANSLFRDAAMRALHARVAAGAAPLPGVGADAWLGMPLSAAERSAARSVMRDLRAGTADAGAVSRAASAALAEHVADIGRQVSGHVHSEDHRSHAKFMSRFAACQSGIDLVAAAEARATGQRLATRASRPTLDLDLDLRA